MDSLPLATKEARGLQKKREFCLQMAFGLEITTSNHPWVSISSLLVCPENVKLSPSNHVNQFLKNPPLSLHAYTAHTSFFFLYTFKSFFKFAFNWRIIALQRCIGFCCTMWISLGIHICWDICMLGKIEGKRRRGRPGMRWLDSITNSMDINLSKLREIVKDRKAWHAAVHGVTELDTTDRPNNNKKTPSL